MTTPTLVPDGFLKQVLNEFGLQWTHIAVFSGAAFSVFGLERYVHAGIWMIGTLACFCLVFLFRRQVSGNFPRALMVTSPLVFVLVAVPVWLIRRFEGQVGPWIAANRLPTTAYLTLVIMTPLAYLILSYRVQEQLFGGPYPTEIRSSIRSDVVDLPFYRKDQLYRLKVLQVEGDRLVMEMDLSYILVNRTKVARELAPGVAPGLRVIRPKSVHIGGKQIALTDPEILTDRGMRVTRTFPAESETEVRFVVEVDYGLRDNDLFTSWLPATSLCVTLTNDFPEIQFFFEHLMARRVDPETEGSAIVYRVDGGLLPYQGFRMTWMRREEAHARLAIAH